jgi:hypothetical protein
MEALFERFWRESGFFGILYGLVTAITDTWYGVPLLVGCSLVIVGLLFRLTVSIHKRHMARLKPRDE